MRRKSERVKSSPSVKQPESVTRRTSRRNKKSPEKSITEEESENTSDHGSQSESGEEVVVKRRAKRGGRTSAAEETPVKATRSRRKTANKKDVEAPVAEEPEAEQDPQPEKEPEKEPEKDPEEEPEQEPVQEEQPQEEIAAVEEEAESKIAEQPKDNNVEANDKREEKEIATSEQPAQDDEDEEEEGVEISISVNESLMISQEESLREAELEEKKAKRALRFAEKVKEKEAPKPAAIDEPKVGGGEGIPEDPDKSAQVSTTTAAVSAAEKERKDAKPVEKAVENSKPATADSNGNDKSASKLSDETNGKVSSATPVQVVSTKPKLLNKRRENEASAKTPIVRKRKWLSSKSSAPKVQEIAISSDSLKGIISDVKPVPLADIKLESSPEPDHESDDVKVVSSTSIDYSRRSEERTFDASPTADDSNDAKPSAVHASRKVSIVQEADEARPPSPPKHTPCNILYITNLVRPFTVLQLKGLLQRTGKIVEDGFWIDKIKSKCFVKYDTEE